MDSRYIKNLISPIPINNDRKALILALKDSAEAFVSLCSKKFMGQGVLAEGTCLIAKGAARQASPMPFGNQSWRSLVASGLLISKARFLVRLHYNINEFDMRYKMFN